MELKAKGISKTFLREGKGTNVFYAVKETDFTLEAGKLTEITGASGSGKSTFANMLSGLLRPSSGSVLADGADIYALSDRERSALRNKSISVIPQVQTGLMSLTVLENVLLPVSMYKRDDGKKEKAIQLLKRFGIDALLNVYCKELSGGEMRRMAIARAFITDPEIIIADEPTGDLDSASASDVYNAMTEYTKTGASVLMVTHDANALPFADSVYVMENGRLSKYAEKTIKNTFNV